MTASPINSAHFRDLRFDRDVARLHSLGARALAELLREIGAETLHMTTIEAAVERYAQLDPDALRRLGGDRFPPRPSLRIVGGLHHG
jgi:hypothetical protein